MTDAPEGTERRREQGERRQYTRRTPTATPPYFDAFERIAVALEQIAEAVAQRPLILPPEVLRPRSPAQ